MSKWRILPTKLIIVAPNKPTPFCFPILVDRLSREKLSNETIDDRVKKMKVAFGS